jgi:hypothetical protein
LCLYQLQVVICATPKAMVALSLTRSLGRLLQPKVGCTKFKAQSISGRNSGSLLGMLSVLGMAHRDYTSHKIRSTAFIFELRIAFLLSTKNDKISSGVI